MDNQIEIYLDKQLYEKEEVRQDIIKKILEVSSKHSYYTISHYPFDQNISHNYIIYPNLIDKKQGLTKIINDLKNIEGIIRVIDDTTEKAREETEKPAFLRKIM